MEKSIPKLQGALEYLLLNDCELISDNDLIADAVKDLVIGTINETDFADVLYAQYYQENASSL